MEVNYFLHKLWHYVSNLALLFRAAGYLQRRYVVGNNMNTLENIIAEIKKIDNEISTIYLGINEIKINDLEDRLGMKFPKEFKDFLNLCNGFEIMSDKIYGIHPEDKNLDLFSNYMWEKEESGNPIYKYLLPISPDGFGNHYCLDLTTLDENKETCKIVFWQHDFYYSESEAPDLECETFLEFLIELVNDIKESIN